DEKRLRQVLLNLLSNAIKFTVQGTMTLSAKVQPLYGEASNSGNSSDGSGIDTQCLEIMRFRFQVQDTGVGMTPIQLASIFNPFEQVGDVKKRAEGTGLGLAISQRIVAMMGGELKVSSTLGTGSLFWFDVELRLADEQVEVVSTQQRGKIVGYQGPRRRIVVVDDGWENRSVLVNLLQPLGFEVYEASNGQEGLTTVMSCRPDMVITDLVMPVLGGMEMLEAIMFELNSNNKAGGDRDNQKIVPVIASASVSLKTVRDRMQSCGALVLSKPIQAETLFSLLQEQLALSWIYAEIPKTGVSADRERSIDFVYPARTILERLMAFADSGDIYGVSEQAQRLLDGLLDKDKDHAPFFRHLIELAEDFQIQPIKVFIQQGMET
ncbi:MAG: ATP-binding protein, partial [Cyanobacteria bacterium J06649_4]